MIPRQHAFAFQILTTKDQIRPPDKENTIHLTELLYLGLATLLGNRTLGEEYRDILEIEDDTPQLASLFRRLGYISSVVFAPWFLAWTLPALRRKLRAKLERNVKRAKRKAPSTSFRL